MLNKGCVSLRIEGSGSAQPTKGKSLAAMSVCDRRALKRCRGSMMNQCCVNLRIKGEGSLQHCRLIAISHIWSVSLARRQFVMINWKPYLVCISGKAGSL